MCDCFHVVLPTWPGAPGSASGHQLQPEEPDVETEEDASVTEGPSGEVIRPQPQGSSPVYECTTEGTGFRVQEDGPSRRGSAGRRASWWKRGSGDARTFSSMSCPESMQEAMEVMFKTEVEAGASGYSVTGGGDQGIFVQQVLKDSSAAKLFSLREGDQLLSATIFFDDIKYEDALKILQYSEPYKVQFQIKRQLCATEGQQDEEAVVRGTETPTKAPGQGGDQEKLTAKPRGARGRKPRERLSWPRLQGLRGTQGAGPRRAHSSSEAHERGGGQEVSPTSTDPEFQLPVEHGEQTAWTASQKRRRRFLNLRLKVGSRLDPSVTGHPDREALGGLDTARVLEEKPEDTEAAPSGRSQERARVREARQALTTQETMELSFPGQGGEDTARQQRKMKQVKAREEATTQRETRASPALVGSKDEEWEELQSLENGTTTMSPQDATVTEGPQRRPQEIQVQIGELKTPKFTFSMEKVQEIGDEIGRGLQQSRPMTFRAQWGHEAERENKTDTVGNTRPAPEGTGPGKDQQDEVSKPRGKQEGQGEEIEKERGEEKWKLSMLKIPEFGRSAKHEVKTQRAKHTIGKRKERKTWKDKEETIEGQRLDHKDPQVDIESSRLQVKDAKVEIREPEVELSLSSAEVDIQAPGGNLQGEVAAKDSKFKMPSFAMSAPSKSMEASLQVCRPKAEADVDRPAIQGDLKTPKVSMQLPSADLDLQAGQVGVKLAQGTLTEAELPAVGTGLKGHLPKVQMPSIKVPKVELKGPQVDIKGLRVQDKVATGEIGAPELEVSHPSVEVDVQAPGGKLQGEVVGKDSKFKMPKFKMPSFGVSAPGKSMEASPEVSMPKLEADVDKPDMQGDLKTSKVNIQLPSADVDLQAGQVGVKLAQGTLSEAQLPTMGEDLKGHLPKVQMPSIKMPKVDLKGPQVDIKGPQMVDNVATGEIGVPELEVSLPSVDVDVRAPGGKLQGEVATKDSKFKMPKFKMPSFSVSAPGKSTEASFEVSVPKMQADVDLPAIQGDLKTPEVGVQLPSADLDLHAGQVGMKVVQGSLPEAELIASGADLKGHLSEVQMPSIKMPKVDLKGPQVDIKGPQMEDKVATGEIGAPELEVSLPSVEVDVQAPGGKLQGEVVGKDSKFKMPKFKIPSFGVTAPGKSMEASLEVSMPKLEADVDKAKMQGDLKTPKVSMQLPSADLDLQAGQVGVKLAQGTLSEAELPTMGAGLKGHLPKVQMPSIKVPKVELKGPQVDIKGLRVQDKVATGEIGAPELEVSHPSVEVDVQAPGGKLQGEVVGKDSKFKMPKFKMPSFGVSAPGKSMEASPEVSMPKLEADVDKAEIQGDLKTSKVNIQLPSADVDLQAGQVGVKLAQGTLSEAQLPTMGEDQKGHLPKVQIPSIKMPKVDLNGPQVDIKGPQMEDKVATGEIGAPELEVSLPRVEVDVQAPGGKLQGEVVGKDSKFKMPKFKIPSFGVTAPGKSMEASLEVSMPKLEADVDKAEMQGDLKTLKVKVQLPSADVDLQAGQVGVKLAQGTLSEAQLPTMGADLKGHLPKVQMPSIKMPKVDLKGPQVDIKGPQMEDKVATGEIGAPELEVSLPSEEVDVQAPGGKLQGEVVGKDSKFKMPKFKMPSFGVSAPGKSMEASLEVSMPKLEADVDKAEIQGDLKTPKVSMQLPSADLDLQAGQVGVKLAQGTLTEAELPAVGTGLKGHLPKVQMPSIKVPKVELKGPQVDIKGLRVQDKVATGEIGAPELEVSHPRVEVDVQAPGGKLQGEVVGKDSKFKMPKFKMPSFGVTAPGKSMEASLEVSMPKLEADVDKPEMQGDLKTPKVKVQLPSADVDLQAGQVGVKLAQGTLSEAELPTTGTGLKGHLPKVQIPKVDLKGPQVDIKGPQMEDKVATGEIGAPELEVSLPSEEVDVQAPGGKLQGEVVGKDSKFKMPKFKMPSFGVSAPGKSMEASLEVSMPKLEADVDKAEIQGDLKTPKVSMQLPSADLDLQAGQVGVKLAQGTLSEAELPTTGAGLKGHLPKVQMPSIKVPKVELKGPQVDIKGLRVQDKVATGEIGAPELEVSHPSVEVDVQAPGGKLQGEVVGKDSKFKMPKFKIPSFGVTAPGKSMEASLEVSMPKLEADVDKAEMQGDLKTPKVKVQLPSADVDLQAGQVGVKLTQGTLSEAQLPATGADLKGHLPKVQMPSIKMPKVDLKGPQVDIKGPQMEDNVATGEIGVPELEVSLPSVDVDVRAPGGKLQGEVVGKDSKFKMPKFKMPSFSVSAPGKSTEASFEVSVPKMQADVDLPAIQGDLKTPEVGVQLPSADLDLHAGQVGMKVVQGSLPEAELIASGADLKGHLSEVQMPSIKMPKVDLNGPQVDIKGPQMEDKVATGEIGAPELEVSLPSVEVDVQAPGGKLQGEVVGKDSKFKMPKFKIPSFGVSAPGKSMEASLEVSMPKLEADVDKAEMQGDLKTPKVKVQLPSADVDLQAGQVGVKLAQGTLSEAELPTTGAGLKGHLPKVQMPSIKVPKVELKGPQVDIKGLRVQDKVATGEIGAPELEVSHPSVEVDVQAPGGKLQGEVVGKDSKFKMPKFKMPSFGVSAPGKSMEASPEVSMPKLEADVDKAEMQGDLKTSKVNIQLPSADVDLQAGQVGVKLAQGTLSEAQLPTMGADLKGHLPKVQIPSIKMPKVDLKGPQVDIKGPQMEDKVATGEIGVPELEVSLPSVEVDVQAPGGKLQGEVVGKDSKFKMPKFKMPSFSVSAPGKSTEASFEVSVPKMQADVDLPAIQGDLKTPEVGVQLPSADLDLHAGQVGMKVVQGSLPEAELIASGADLKGHLPKVQMPSIKMPKVDLKGPQVDIKGPQMEDKVATGEIGAPELEVSHPRVEVDVQAPGGKLQGEVVGKDSKFKMPKFKMPSFGVTAPGKSMEASLEVSMPKLEADVDKAEMQGDLKTPKVKVQLPSADVDLQAGQVGVKLTQGTLSEAQLPATGADLKGHLPKVQMPSIKMPKVDLKGPQVDIKGLRVQDKVATGEIGAPELEVSHPSVEVDVQAPGGKLQGEVVGKDSKFKMPKFKMPSFSVSAPGKSTEASFEVSVPKMQADVDLPAIQGDLKTPEVGVQLPSADLDLHAGQVGMKVVQGSLPEAELIASGADLKGHLPKVQMPSIKMPKVDLKGPQVDIKGPQMEDKVATGEIGAPELEVSHPSVEVDVQAPGGKLQGEVVGKDSKFKMPKFKMPSFGVTAPGKSMEASLEVSMPKLEADVDKAEIQGDLKTPKVSMQLPSADLDLQAGQVGVKLAQGTLSEAELPTTGAGLKGHLPKVQMPSIKVPKVELKGPQVDIKGLRVQDKVATGEIGAPELEVSHPSVEVDVQAPGGKLQGEVVGKDSKFKMPKFKMPSFGVSAPGKSMEASPEVSMPKLEADVDKAEIQGDLKTSKVNIQLPSADVDLQAGQVGVKLAQGTLSEAELPTTGADLKGHLPKVQIPSIKMPKVDLKGPQVDIKGPQMEDKVATGEIGVPELEVSLPSVEVDVQAPGGKLQGEVVGKDSKFKMPKFKMPSFSVSAPGKSTEASFEVSVPKMQADVDLPAIQGDLKTPEVGVQLPSADLDLHAGQVGMKVVQGSLPEAELIASGADLKGHLPKVQMPSIKMPKVDLKGPQVDIKGPQMEDKVATGEIGAPELEVSHPRVEVDVQAPGGKLQGEVVGKDSKFKMPKFKMPSFGVTAPGKSMEASLEVSMPKLEADVDKAEMQGDLKTPKVKVQLPSADVDLQAGQVGVKLTQGTLSEAQLPATGADLKGHLPKVQMPSIKMPKVDLKGPQVDIKGLRVQDKVATGEIGAPELEVSHPSVEVDVQAPGGKLQGEVVGKDSKFKMPKFKMPSFSVSAPGKSTEASFEVSVPKMQADVDLPAIQGDLKTPEVGVQLPSADLDLHAGQVGMKVVQGSLPEAELIASGADLKGHLPKVQMPSIKMPKVDLKGPQVDIKGPQMEDKVATGEIGAPELEVSHPSVEVDVQAPGGKLQGEVVGKDSKFKMPKFKMPSFGVTAPGKSMEASLEVSMPKLEADVDKAEIQGDLKTPKVSMQLPSADLDLQAGQVGVKLAQGTLSEAELPTTGAGLKGHLPKVQMPSIKVPKVELKGPQVDIKGLRVQDKVATGEIGAPELEVSHPSVEVDVQAPGGKLQGEVVGKDSKFKMPKFKMPSFSVSAPGKSTESSFEVSVPKMQADVDLPAIQGDLKTPEVGVQLPSADLDLHAGQVGMKVVQGSLPEAELIASGADLKGHLPKVQMPSIKMPKVDLKGPQVDIKGPQMEDKVATGEIGAPELEVSHPRVEVDVQAPGGKLQGEVVGKDSKFKMPKFKMPSFGVTAPGKSMEASLEVSMPKLEADVDKAEMQGDLKTPKVKVQLPSADVDLQAGQVGVKLTQGTLSEAQLPATGADLKGHLPKVQMPSIKMPKVDLKGPQVDIKGLRVQDKVATGEIGAPELEVSHPSVEVDVQAPGGKLQGEVVGKDSKFKMPKFKMPSFSVSAPGKSTEASFEVSVPKMQADVDLPAIQGDLKTPEVGVQLPSADLDLHAGQVGMKVVQGSLPEAELIASGADLKGHLPKVQMPSIKMPKVDLKGPQVDIKGPQMEDKVATGEIGAPELEVSHPSVEVDVQAPGGKLQGEVVGKDSKFKMPKFKMPSFGVSAPGKSMEASLEVSMPKLEADVDKPEMQGDLKTSKVNIQLPSADVDLQAGQVGVKLAQGTLSEAQLPTMGEDLKGHLPKVQMPSIKMPKVDLNGPQVDIKGPQMEDKVATGEIGVPELEVSLPSVDVDVRAPGGKLQGEVVGKDSKFKMPKFKIPSFSVSAPGKSTEASFEVSVPKMQADVDLPAIQGDLKTPEVGVQLPSADLDLHAGQVGMKVVQGSLPEAELIASGADLKGHLSEVQMPSIKMPKVDLKGPQVDIKGPQMEDKVATGEIGAPELEVSLPRVEVDVQAPGGKLQGEVVGKDSKFKMPKFKIPSFGVSAPGKSMEASLEVSVPKVESDLYLPAIQDELKTPEVGVHLTSADVGLVGFKLAKGLLPDAELLATCARPKAHQTKLLMPSIKMPKVELKGSHVDIKSPRVEVQGAEGEFGAPELEVSLPTMKLDVLTAGAQLEAEVETKDSKLHISPLNLPSLSLHTSHAVLSSRNFMENLKFPGMSYTLAPGDPGMAPDECASGDLTESGVSYPFGKDGKACKSKQPPVEKRQVQLCHRKALEGVPGPGEAPSSSHLSGLSLATSPEAALPGLDTALQVPRLALSGLPSLSTGTADLTRVGAGPSVLPPSDGVMVTQFQVPMLSPVFTPGAPQDATSGSPASALFAGVQCSVGHQAEQGPLPIPPGRGFHPKSPLSPRVQSRVTFPMFHKPRFVLSVPLEVAPEADSGSADWSFVPLLSQEPRQDCIHAAKVAQLPVSQPPSTAVPASQVVPELLGPAAGRAAAGVAEQEGKGSPSKTPRFKLPVFSWSPKKEARPREDSTCHLEDPTGSLAMGLDHEDPHPGAQDSRVQSHMALTPEREGDSGRTRKAGFVLPRLALPKLKAFKGPAGLRPPGDADAVLCSSTAAGDCGATERGGSEGGVGSTGLPGGPHEEGDVTLQLPQTSSPWVGSAKLDLGSFPAEEGASQCDADPRCDSAVGGGSEGFGLRDISARQPQGEGTAPNIEGPLKAPLGHADRVPSLGSPEEAPTAGGPIAGSQERWFRMPRLHMPGFRRLSSKERGGARGQDVAQVHMPVATAPAEAAAVASVLVSWVPGSEVEASVSLKPPDVEAAVTASGSASRADVLKRDLDCSGLKRHPPSLRRSGGDQPGSKVQVHPAEGSFPPQKPSGEPSEAQAPAAERPDLMEAEEGAELRPSGSEGPVPLRVSSTDMPSQVSVLDTRRLWEDSVLTVTFPKLRVPMFSFPAPGAEMDIFFPVVRDVSEAEAGVDPGPGLWGASLLRAGAEEPREQPMGPSRPLEGSPVSKVKVHIQGVQAESREVLVCSQVRPERVEHMAPEAFSTQTVWASEIPASTVQTPSYGFSLLKLKTLGPPAQAPDSRAPEGSAAPTADSLPEDGAPDATEPFEVIAGSTSLPGLQTLGSDDPARPPLAGSGSDDDDEPAEILEFLPEDSSGASAQLAAEDQVPKGRPEGKKPSGLLWSWLPNIGFSSISETNAGSRDDAQRSVPVLTQPGPWPDLEPPKRQERVGWFRFPKLGFSSSPAEKTKSTEEETALAEQKLWEESVTFFDARESFSPEEEERGSKPAEMAPGTPDMVASSARTELILLEPDAPAGEESGPRPAGK